MAPPGPTEAYACPLSDLLGRTVRIGGVLVGQVSGILVDAATTCALGLEIAGAGDSHRFLPWFAAHIDDSVVSVDSAFLLVDGIDGYERRGALVLRDAAGLTALAAAPDGALDKTIPLEHVPMTPGSFSGRLRAGNTL
jgi:hypothetical protein